MKWPLLSTLRFGSVDHAFLRGIASIDWFAHCGQQRTPTLPFVAQPVYSWSESIAACQSQDSRDANLEARNALSSFLHAKYQRRFQRWNDLTDEIKRTCITPLMSQVWQPFAEAKSLPAAFVDCVAWQVLAGAMENEYRDCKDLPLHFSHLLKVYRRGLFPCGWAGQWPQGKLLVF